MGKYCRLTQAERYQIEALRARRIGVRSIARQLKRPASTISRELVRSYSFLNSYSALEAENRAKQFRHSKRPGCRKIIGATERYIRQRLKEDWSPQQISKRMKIEKCLRISHTSIYRYINLDRQEMGDLWRHLRISRKSGRYKKKRWAWKSKEKSNRVSIDERPKIVDLRKRQGDYERDLVEGTRGQSALLTIVDRRSRKLFLEKVEKKAGHPVHLATVRALRKQRVFTITNDNGSEFSRHEKTAKALRVKIYFSHPNSSWERGTNENTNGLLRQYFPKKHTFDQYSAATIKRIEEKLNNRPRRCLDYKTPNEVHRTLKS